MRKPIELNYVKKNGMLYPDLQISNNKDDDKRPIGKYGMMWLRFMHEWHYDRYIELRMSGELLSFANRINNETYKILKTQLKSLYNFIDHAIVESNIIKDFVLISR